MSEKILITGAFGQLGQAVTHELKSGFRILAVDQFQPQAISPKITALKVDVSKPDSVRAVVAQFRPDVIVNLAALTDVDKCETNPELAESINVNSISAMQEEFSEHFIQISTDYVFDGAAGPYSEKAQTNPVNVYGRTKLSADEIVSASDYPWTILRTNVVYDYTPWTQASFVKWIINSLEADKPIRVVNDQWNNPTWAKSLAKVIKRVITSRLTGLYNYGGADYLHRLDFAREIAQVFRLDSSLITPVSTQELNQAARRPLICGLTTGLIESKLGISCVPVITGLEAIRRNIQQQNTEKQLYL